MEKGEIIQAINEIRKEIGLRPYPLEELEAKSIEELRELYHQYFVLRENYRKRIKEEKKFKLNFKTALLIGVPVIVMTLLFFQFTLRKPGETSLPLSSKEGKEAVKMNETVKRVDFNIQSAFKGPDDNYMLVIQNNGTENITFSEILVDNKKVNYKIFSGFYPPLVSGGIVYLQLSKSCDGLSHNITIMSENKTIEIEAKC
jgi:hypothetical protein